MNLITSILAYSALFVALLLMIRSFFALVRPHHGKRLARQQARKVS